MNCKKKLKIRLLKPEDMSIKTSNRKSGDVIEVKKAHQEGVYSDSLGFNYAASWADKGFFEWVTEEEEHMKARINDAVEMGVDGEHSNGDIVELNPSESRGGYYDSWAMYYSEGWFEKGYIKWVDDNEPEQGRESMKALIIDAEKMDVEGLHYNGAIVEMLEESKRGGFYDGLGFHYDIEWFEKGYIKWISEVSEDIEDRPVMDYKMTHEDFFTILTQASKQFRLSIEIDPEGRFTVFTPEADGPYRIYSEQGFKDFLKAYENLLEFKEENV